MNTLSVTAALAQRHSTREFSDKPVEKSQLEKLLVNAGLSPSGGNLQPWKVYALTGQALANAKASIAEKIFSGELETPDFPTYPSPLGEPYRSRRFDCGELMYAALDIPREDKGARIGQALKNFEFFGAPVGIIITMERGMDMPQAVDIGIYLQSLMLLAQEEGLASCPQVSWSAWPQAVADALSLPKNEKVMVGLSLGYAAETSAVNEIRQPRAELSEFATIHGYE